MKSNEILSYYKYYENSMINSNMEFLYIYDISLDFKVYAFHELSMMQVS